MAVYVEREIKTEFYNSNNQPSTHKLCLVGMNREHLRRVVRHRFDGSNGAKLMGAKPRGMSFGFIYFRSGTDAWNAWNEVSHDREILVFVQNEMERDWGINYLNQYSESRGDRYASDGNRKTNQQKQDRV